MRLRQLAVGVLAALVATGLTAAPAQGVDTQGHHIRNMDSHLCLVSRQGAGERPVIQSTCDYSAGTVWEDQYWRLIPVDEDANLWRVQNVLTRLCVVARGYEPTTVIATVCGPANGYLYADGIWRIEYIDKWDAFRYQNYKSDLCLAVRGDQEVQAVTAPCDEQAADQHWW
ncbi:ricin-type beta-trefoil lectin domain protein [Actinokineospora fastidiosa]|uniref:Ricin B lectin domain-containing protein n=1 Tax=Actinokineospora fastidiosa TaxID=1816 RepID=A0A918G8K2_9PSEU|nr:ricin-type beta-trefoil lectin domain protein [Actinokineospora fastidiosa]GGS21164.1 hypothetical protein GCM10010171_12330 [Actinokineospora fastidiosa]